MGDFTTAGEVESVTAHEVINNILTLQFNGYMTDTEVVNIYRGVPGAKFTTLGTREAPCIIEVMPLASMQRYVISGLDRKSVV